MGNELQSIISYDNTQDIGINPRTNNAMSLFRRETAGNGQHTNSHDQLRKDTV